jgi:hypothetical protein
MISFSFDLNYQKIKLNFKKKEMRKNQRRRNKRPKTERKERKKIKFRVLLTLDPS